MKRAASFIASICVVFSVSLLFAQDDSKPKERTESAIVLLNECRFTFPIERLDRKWSWGISAANNLEYSWMVTVKTGGDKYQLGFSFFNPGAIPEDGSFADLLKVGQTNLWQINPDGGATYVERARIQRSVENDRLVFSIVDKDLMKRLFKDKPKVLLFETGGTQLSKTKKEVPVEYKPGS